MTWDWSSVGDFLDRLDRGLGTNLVYLAPHAPIRIEVMGYAPRAATREEIARMQELLRQALEEGAAGLSTGLNFSPACYATTEEIAALCEVVREYGGIHASHMRDYLDDVESGIAEVVAIGRKTGVASHIAHFAAVGRNKGRSDEMLGMIDAAIRKMTSFPARRFGLRGRGLICEGFYADLVVFDPERILDTATFERSNRFPEGIAYVIVNGTVVGENGSPTGARPGRVVRRA